MCANQWSGRKSVALVLGACLGSVALGVGSAAPSWAQATPTPLEDLQTKDGADFFNGRGNSQTGSMMNFIQNAIIGTPRSNSEFQADSQENFDEATSSFRKQQADLFRQKQAAPGNPSLQVDPLPTPATSN